MVKVAQYASNRRGMFLTCETFLYILREDVYEKKDYALNDISSSCSIICYCLFSVVYPSYIFNSAFSMLIQSGNNNGGV